MCGVVLSRAKMPFAARDLTLQFNEAELGDKYGPDLVVGIFDKKTDAFCGGFAGDNTSLCGQDTPIWNGGIRDVSNPQWFQALSMWQLHRLFFDLARPMTLKQYWCYPREWSLPHPRWTGGKGMMVRQGFSGSKEDFIAEWTEAMSRFELKDGRRLLGDAFIGGADAGMNENDLALICKVNGSNRCVTGGPGYYQYEKEGITGRIMVHVARMVAQAKGLRWDENLRVGIWGFGNVGRGVAMWLARDEYSGPRLVAVSDLKKGEAMGVYADKGYDPKEWLAAAKSPSGIFSLPSSSYVAGEECHTGLDIVFLGLAREAAIDSLRAPLVNAKMVISGTNSGITLDAYKILERNRVLAPPDFMVNIGAAATAKWSWHGCSDELAVALAVAATEVNLRWLMSAHLVQGGSMHKIAREEVFRELVPRK